MPIILQVTLLVLGGSSYGKDVRGLNRLHQFDKVEIVRLEKEDKSLEALFKMVEHVEKIVMNLTSVSYSEIVEVIWVLHPHVRDFELFSADKTNGWKLVRFPLLRIFSQKDWELNTNRKME